MTALIAHARCAKHQPGAEHPEAPERFAAVLQGLEDAALTLRLQRLPPLTVGAEDLRTVHSARYLALAEREIAAGEEQLSTGDTAVGRESWTAALAGAGSALAGVDAVLTGAARNAFCIVRPPGHHAGPEQGMGFCILNNIALAARRAQQRHGLERVLIVDWDVHHGNGTQDVFYEDGSRLLLFHASGPMVPRHRPRERNRSAVQGREPRSNCPLPAGSGCEEMIAAFRDRGSPATEPLPPQLVLISAGFDSRAAIRWASSGSHTRLPRPHPARAGKSPTGRRRTDCLCVGRRLCFPRPRRLLRRSRQGIAGGVGDGHPLAQTLCGSRFPGDRSRASSPGLAGLEERPTNARAGKGTKRKTPRDSARAERFALHSGERLPRRRRGIAGEEHGRAALQALAGAPAGAAGTERCTERDGRKARTPRDSAGRRILPAKERALPRQVAEHRILLMKFIGYSLGRDEEGKVLFRRSARR